MIGKPTSTAAFTGNKKGKNKRSEEIQIDMALFSCIHVVSCEVVNILHLDLLLSTFIDSVYVSFLFIRDTRLWVVLFFSDNTTLFENK